MKTYYHATAHENMSSIMEQGILARNIERTVYLAETPEDAAKFLAIRLIRQIIVFKVKIPKRDEHKIEETFDHNPNVFRCRAFGYSGDIPPNYIEPYMRYNL